jgi:peptide-N4-(N-acetyl-beta-glucosaminyl)asparagine amidase
MQFSALLRHFTFPYSNTLGKATPKPTTQVISRTEEQQSSVGKQYMKMGDKTCWEASGGEREKFKILSKEIQAHQKLWGSPSGSGSISTWGLYMIGLTPEDAVPTLLFCCHNKALRKELRRSIESSGILAKEEYRHIRVGDCFKPPEFCVADDKLRLLSSQEGDEHGNAASDQDDLIRIESEWENFPARMKVTFENASMESNCQYSTIGMTFQHQGKTFAVTAGHTLSHDLHSSLAEEDTLDFEFDLGEGCDADYSDFHGHHIPPIERQNINTPSDDWGENDTPSSNWRPRNKIFIRNRNLDFAIIQEHGGIPVTHHTSCPFSLQELLRKASREPKDTQVIAETASLGRINGRLSGTPSFIRLPHAMHFEEVWTVQLSGRLTPGDSGALVSDVSSGRIFGHIVAGAPQSGVAYIMPAFKVLERIQLYLDPRETVRPTTLEDDVMRKGEQHLPKENSNSSVSCDSYNPYDHKHLNQRVVAIAAAGFFVDSYNVS